MLSLLDAPSVLVALNRLVKDGLRRDFAVLRLANSNTGVAVLANDLGLPMRRGFAGCSGIGWISIASLLWENRRFDE